MKILALDVESNGLFGRPFAIGGCVVEDGRVNTFIVRRPLIDKPDPFVQENVLPVMEDVPCTHGDTADLCEAFWQWFRENQENALVFVDVGYPVESNMMRWVQTRDEKRHSQGPYPLHELATLLLAKGYDPDINRLDLLRKLKAHCESFSQHNPLHDAVITALIVYKLLR